MRTLTLPDEWRWECESGCGAGGVTDVLSAGELITAHKTEHGHGGRMFFVGSET